MKDLNGFQRDLIYLISKLSLPTGNKIQTKLSTQYQTEIGYNRVNHNLIQLVELAYLIRHPIDRQQYAYFLSEHAHEKLRARRSWEREQIRGTDVKLARPSHPTDSC